MGSKGRFGAFPRKRSQSIFCGDASGGIEYCHAPIAVLRSWESTLAGEITRAHAHLDDVAADASEGVELLMSSIFRACAHALSGAYGAVEDALAPVRESLRDGAHTLRILGLASP